MRIETVHLIDCVMSQPYTHREAAYILHLIRTVSNASLFLTAGGISGEAAVHTDHANVTIILSANL